jgi:hypothetical protein
MPKIFRQQFAGNALSLRCNQPSAGSSEGAIAITRMSQLEALESLDLVGNGIADAGAKAIAQSPYLSGLKELRISRNPLRKKSWTMLELQFGMALAG